MNKASVRQRRRLRPLPTRFERSVVLLAVTAGGIGAAFCGGEPTGNRMSDVLLAAAVGVAMPAACSISRTWTWALAAGVAASLATGPWVSAGVAALAIAVVTASRGDLPQRRAAGAAIGALSVQGLLRLDIEPFGQSALLAGFVIAVALLSGWQLAREGVRDRLRPVAKVAGGVAAAIVALFVLSALLGRSDVQKGIRQAQQGLEAARQGDADAAADFLDQASRSFDNAHDYFMLARPAVLLPVVGPQARAMEAVSDAGAAVAATSATAARDADVQSLQVAGGQLDLARVASMEGPIQEVLDALDKAQGAARHAQSPWLLAPVADRLDSFTTSVDDAQEDASVAAQALAVVPGLFGKDGPRHYLLAFATPSETRDLGGFTGAYGELVIDDGKLDLTESGRIQELNERGRGRILDHPEVYPNRFLAYQLNRFWQNITATPDFPTAASAAHQLWPQSGGGPLDGVLYVDPYGLAALLKLTGPITVPGYNESLTFDNTANFLLVAQYLFFAVNEERKDFLDAVSRTTFDALTERDLPGPRTVADALAPIVDQRRLLLHSFHPEEQALFERIGIDGSFPPVDGGDVLSVRSSNLGQDKIDAFLDRSLAYDVTVDPSTGEVAAVLTVTLHNGAPPAGLPAYLNGNPLGLPTGTNAMSLAVYTPLRLVSVTNSGVTVPNGAGLEYGRNLYTVLVYIPPTSDVTLRFDLEGTVDRDSDYSLRLVPQPLVHADEVNVKVQAIDGWAIDEGTGTLDGVLDEDERLAVTFRRQ